MAATTVPLDSVARPAPLDIRALLHPTEQSRLLIALSSSAVVFGGAAMICYALSGWTLIIGFGAAVVAVGGLIWLVLQVSRSRLLGGAVRVSAATLPELQSVLDEVRARLRYDDPVDVYVLDKVEGGSAMTSYLGTRVILVEGGLVSELLDEEHRPELVYLIGRHFGALKARHQRLLPILIALSVVDALKFLHVFLAPYFRATTKSGDQIAAACCGDVRASARMMNRLLVGKELGPRVALSGVLDQAAVVRKRWLPRMAQLFMNEPHATNRYLNLLGFVHSIEPDRVEEWRASLDDQTARRLGAVLEGSPHRRPQSPRSGLLSVVIAAGVTCGLFALVAWATFGTGLLFDPPDTPPGPTPEVQLTATEAQLLARVPDSFEATCGPATLTAEETGQGIDAVMVCQPGTSGVPADIRYLHYQDAGTLAAAYANLSAGLATGDCSSEPGQDSYWLKEASDPIGYLACSVNDSGAQVYVWTDSRLAILGYAADPNMGFAELKEWWLTDSGPQQ